ncbi:MAG: FKBP-type peptidyl-prolyl cis-trans isomerase [Sulfuricella sp.]|nr:FKBP-type peptidyl-prolyl cis-trans isomerase [Sulfuricella sp.]
MSQEKVGKHKAVYITYAIKDQDGNVLEQMDMPVGYIHRAGSGIFEKVEDALEGRCIGDHVEITLSPAEGFGEHQPELTFTDDINNVPPEFRHLGAEVEFSNDNGETLMFKVTQIADGKLTVDGNHPMAGKTVVFNVTINAIRPADASEIAAGRPADSELTTLH